MKASDTFEATRRQYIEIFDYGSVDSYHLFDLFYTTLMSPRIEISWHVQGFIRQVVK